MATPQMSLEQVTLGMAQTNEIFNTEVFGNRNFSALDQVYTSSARILPPGAPMISGREAIKKFWSDLVVSANAKSAVLTSLDVMPAGDGVVEIGQAVLTVEPPGQAAAQMERGHLESQRLIPSGGLTPRHPFPALFPTHGQSPVTEATIRWIIPSRPRLSCQRHTNTMS